MTGPATDIVTERTVLPQISFTLQWRMVEKTGLNIFSSLYAELLLHPVGLYANMFQDLRMMGAKMVKKQTRLSVSTNVQS